MENKITQTAKSDLLDLGREEPELVKPQILFDGVITGDLLDKWTNDVEEESDARTASMSDTVWGTIRWNKQLGRPLTPTLAEAFVIHHQHTQKEWVMVGPGIAQEISIIAPHPEPSKWDGPNSNDYHQITFVTQAHGRRWEVNRIGVTFATGVRWANTIFTPKIGTRRLSPDYFFSATGKRIVLEPWEVTYK